MHVPEIAARVTAFSTTQSPYPASFDNSPWLYGTALAALISISFFSLIIGTWMVGDIWKDRTIDHPYSLPFGFRAIIALVCVTAFMRCVPEVMYMTFYGEVTGAVMAQILTLKRVADIVALPVGIMWMAWLVVIYPHIMLELRSYRARTTPSLNFVGNWWRLARPFTIMVAVIFISALIAAAKGSMGQ